MGNKCLKKVTPILINSNFIDLCVLGVYCEFITPVTALCTSLYRYLLHVLYMVDVVDVVSVVQCEYSRSCKESGEVRVCLKACKS